MKRLAAILIPCLLINSGCSSLGGIISDTPPKEPLSFTRLKDKPANEYVAHLVSRLAAYCKEKPYLLVSLLETSRVQGIAAYLTQEISLTRGMLNVVSDEAELAALLSHEIGHVVLNHMKRRKSGNAWLGIWDLGLSAILGNSELKREILEQQKQINQAGWGRALEEEADVFGAELARYAGYDPYAFCDLFDRMSGMLDADPFYHLKKIKGTHPALDERAAKLRAYLKEKGYPPNQGLRNPQIYRAAMSGFADLRTNEKPPRQPAQAPPTSELEKRDLEKIAALSREVEGYAESGNSMPVEQFVRIMQAAALIAQRNGFSKNSLQAELLGVGGLTETPKFMEEVIYQDSPLWGTPGEETKNPEISSGLKGLFTNLGRVGVGFIPVASDAIDLYEFLTGTDLFTGDKLSGFERILTAVGLIYGSGAAWRNTVSGLEQELSFQAEKAACRLVAENVPEARAMLKHAVGTFESGNGWTRRYAGVINREYGQPPYWKGTSVYETTLNKESYFYRIHGSDKQVGAWLLQYDPRQYPRELIQEIVALPEKEGRQIISAVKVPKGTKIRVGVAGENKFGRGGAIQWEVVLGKAFSEMRFSEREKALKELGLVFVKLGYFNY